MEQNCSTCGEIVKIIPAGVSKKTGNPYNSFYKCKGCGHSENVGAPVQKEQYIAQPDEYKQRIAGYLEKLFAKQNVLEEKIDRTFDLLQRIEADRAKEAFKSNPLD